MKRVVLLAVIVALGWAQRGSAQCPSSPYDDSSACSASAPRWAGNFTVFSANAILAGVTAGVLQHVRGGSFTRGFVTGMVGGGVVGAGKWVVAQRFTGAGLLGREIAAIGTSVTRNASFGAGALEELVLPLGPVRLYVRPGADQPVRPKLDLLSAAWLTYGIIEDEVRLDLGESLSSGAPVFRTNGTVLRFGRDSAHAAGVATSGVILVADVPAYGSEFARRALAHERVHVVQGDALFLWWTDPLEDWLIERVPAGARFTRWFDVNLSTELLRTLGGLIPEHGERPWELEAIFLTR